MSGDFFVGILLGVLAGLVNGVFLLPMRYARKWAWENTWMFFTVFSTGVLPWLAAFIAVPHLMSIFRDSPFHYFVPGLVAGSIWGIAQVMYGLGIGILGVAIGSAAISSTATIAGVLGPIIVYAPAKLISADSLVLLVALALIVSGIYHYAKAGASKEKEVAGEDVPKQIVRGTFSSGLTICLTTGILGTAFIYGGKSSAGLISTATAAGASPVFAFYPAYLVTFNAGMVPGVLYSVYKLAKNKTAGNFLTSGSFFWNIGVAASMAILWYSGILMYGMSSEKMGRLGPSIAFVLFGGGTLLFSNLFGWLVGEWKGASRSTIRGFVIGMVFLVLAIFVTAFGMTPPA